MLSTASKFSLATLLLALVSACGCGSNEDQVGIKGKVTVDDQPLESGSITFDPIEGTTGPNAGAVITKGFYEVARSKGPKAGTYRVTIKGYRLTGKKIEAGPPSPPGTLVDEQISVVPADYDAKSTLRAELKAGDNSSTNFDLSSKAIGRK